MEERVYRRKVLRRKSFENSRPIGVCWGCIKESDLHAYSLCPACYQRNGGDSFITNNLNRLKEERKDINDRINQRVVSLYLDGYSSCKVANKINIDQHSVLRRLRALGIEIRPEKNPQENGCKGNLKHGFYVGKNHLHRGRYKNYNKIVKEYKRDHPVCESCGDDKFIELDHIIPLSEGGEHLPQNLRSLCPTCHRLKHKGILIIKEVI